MNISAKNLSFVRFIPIVNLSLILLLVLCFILETKTGAPDNFDKLSSLFGISNQTIKDGHILRLFTANLFHVNSGHLFSNITGLIFFSSLLEIIIGRSRFAIVVLLSSLGGTTGSLIFNMVEWMVGSSTILFGTFGGLGALLIKYRKETSRFFIPAMISWFVCLVLLSTLGYLSLDVVDQGAHTGGIITGFITTWMIFQSDSLTVIEPVKLKTRIFLAVLLIVFGLSVFKEVIPLVSLIR
jgi:rhomboid protease GluP